ncbi:MAG TPA: single-stranded-DNA-specific exonuclease RecJ [Bacteroidales bacterium]|nr:single-stranded-DNA-specific exonuclease RecJ [Bacteroidales bacterium]
MDKRWVLRQQGDPQAVESLSQALNIERVLANLLVQRGIRSFEAAENFFRPKLDHLHDPFLMKDMDLAVARIEEAFRKGEKILVYGDYDVDGTTAVALVYTFIHKLYEKVDYYIPDRYSEGYGISEKGIDFAQENGFSLIIALDCGIKAINKVRYAKAKGIDFIIGDHHRPGDELPEAVAVLDPKRADCGYPYKELSGCGVGFKLIQAYSKKNNLPFTELKRYLDLVVISIASDIVPITGENRILAYFGLKLINHRPRPGIEAILKFSNIRRNTKESITHTSRYRNYFSRELTISDLVFLVGPRINAAGRMESGKNSVRLLVSETLQDSDILGEKINQQNNDRRDLDSQTTQMALDMINNDPSLQHSRTTIVYHPEWHKGVIGIVASRLTENFYKPTIVLTRSNGLITGSARSIKDFDVYEAIDACSDLLEHFGGHKYAAGLSLQPENLDKFRERFENYAREKLSDAMMVPEIEIDAEITLNHISPKFYRVLKQFAPFGPGNMSPVFLTHEVVGSEDTRIVGSNHLKLSVFHPNINTYPKDAIAFQLGQYCKRIQKGERFDFCYHLEENEWNGNVSLQLNVKDIRMIDG